MKLKKVAALCSANKAFFLFDENREGGEIRQWLGDGYSIYLLSGLPLLDENNVCAMFDIPEKKRKKCRSKRQPVSEVYMDLQRGRGPVQARSRADEGRAALKYIDVEDLVPSEDNFYSMSAIDELAALIELSGGVKQPGLVVPLGGGKYKVISGHRRRLASIQLVKQGKETYRKMPCMVEDAEREPRPEADELRAIDEAILLITTNGQREKTDWDKVQEATRLRALLEKKRRFEKIPGETRKLIAEQLGTTPAQVGRYDSIEKHLIPAFKTWLAQEKIGISVAYELSMLPEGVQEEAAAECWGKHGPVTLEDVRRWKEQAAKPAEDERSYKPGVYVREEKTNPINPAVPEPHNLEWEEMPPVQEQAAERDAGKIVGFPAPPSPPPAPSAEIVSELGKMTLSEQKAAVFLEDLRMYCEEMVGRYDERERWKMWENYSDALGVAIDALRMRVRAMEGEMNGWVQGTEEK